VLSLGGIVGVTEIVDCVKDHPSKWYAPAHWAFVLANSRPLPFIQWKGALSIRDVPQALLDLLKPRSDGQASTSWRLIPRIFSFRNVLEQFV
jgi:hypothetical protein